MSLIRLEEARALLLGSLPSFGTETVELDDALGRTLAHPLIAAHTQPAEPRATMDGIAVPDREPPIGTIWSLVGEASAGGGPVAPLKAGQAVRVATGAVPPEGTARVIPQEIVRFAGDEAALTADPGGTTFIRRAGADFTTGDRLLEPGRHVGPSEIGMIAAANYAQVEVARRPRVAICTAGDELVAPGSALAAGQSIDSASHTLAALVRCWGGSPQFHPLLKDDLPSLATALRAALEVCDILLCIGGASVGRRDFMRPAVRSLGAEFLFEGIAVQPGKPCWHARSGGGLILGLPGNPTSAFVCARLLLLPLMERLTGQQQSGSGLTRAFLAGPLPGNGDREQYLRATAARDPEGRLWLQPVSDQDSGLQATLVNAQALIRRLPLAEPLHRGAEIEMLSLT